MSERLDIRADQVRPKDRIRRGNYAVLSVLEEGGRVHIQVTANCWFVYPPEETIGITRPHRNPPAETLAVGLLRKCVDGMYCQRDEFGNLLLDGEIHMTDNEAALVAELLDAHPDDD